MNAWRCVQNCLHEYLPVPYCSKIYNCGHPVSKNLNEAKNSDDGRFKFEGE